MKRVLSRISAFLVALALVLGTLTSLGSFAGPNTARAATMYNLDVIVDSGSTTLLPHQEIESGKRGVMSWDVKPGYYIKSVSVINVDSGSSVYSYTWKSGDSTTIAKKSHSIAALSNNYRATITTALLPNVEISTYANKDTYNATEDAEFTIRLKQTIPNAVATNVQVYDVRCYDASSNAYDLKHVFDFDTAQITMKYINIDDQGRRAGGAVPAGEGSVTPSSSVPGFATLNSLTYHKDVEIKIVGKVKIAALTNSVIRNEAFVVSDQTMPESSMGVFSVAHDIKTKIINGTVSATSNGVDVPFHTYTTGYIPESVFTAQQITAMINCAKQYKFTVSQIAADPAVASGTEVEDITKEKFAQAMIKLRFDALDYDNLVKPKLTEAGIADTLYSSYLNTDIPGLTQGATGKEGYIGDVVRGDSCTLNYLPSSAEYELSYVKVDGNYIDIATHPTSFTFDTLMYDPEVEIVYSKKSELVVNYFADREVYKNNDEINYTVEVDNVVDYATATNVNVSIGGFPQGITVDPSTVVISDPTGTLSSSNGNTLSVDIPRVMEGDPIYITFSAIVNSADMTSSDVVSTATSSYKSAGVLTPSGSDTCSVKVQHDINTYVTGGTITSAIHNIDIGASKTVQIRPQSGYYLSEVLINGENQPLDGFDIDVEKGTGSIKIDDIRQDYDVEVIYLPYYYVRVAVDDGATTSTPELKTKGGETLAAKWSPKDGYYIDKVVVDGTVVYDFATFGKSVREITGPVEQKFESVTSDHIIQVVTAKLVNLSLGVKVTNVDGTTSTLPIGSAYVNPNGTVTIPSPLPSGSPYPGQTNTPVLTPGPAYFSPAPAATTKPLPTIAPTTKPSPGGDGDPIEDGDEGTEVPVADEEQPDVVDTFAAKSVASSAKKSSASIGLEVEDGGVQTSTKNDGLFDSSTDPLGTGSTDASGLPTSGVGSNSNPIVIVGDSTATPRPTVTPVSSVKSPAPVSSATPLPTATASASPIPVASVAPITMNTNSVGSVAYPLVVNMSDSEYSNPVLYQMTVTNESKDTAAKNVVISDDDFDEGIILDVSTIAIEGIDASHFKTYAHEKKGFHVVIDELKPGQTVLVKVNGRATKVLQGKTFSNRVTAGADNDKTLHGEAAVTYLNVLPSNVQQSSQAVTPAAVSATTKPSSSTRSHSSSSDDDDDDDYYSSSSHNNNNSGTSGKKKAHHDTIQTGDMVDRHTLFLLGTLAVAVLAALAYITRKLFFTDNAK